MIKATCTWGDGPDVLITWEKLRAMLYEKPYDFDKAIYGFVNSGSICLTSKEAEDFARSLMLAAKMARELDSSYKEKCKFNEKEMD